MMWNSSVSSSVSFPRKDNGSEEHEAKTSEGPRREETKGSTGRHVACGDPTSVEEKDMKNRCSLELRTPQEGRDGFSSSANQEEIKEDEEKKHLLLAKRTIVSSRGVSPHQEGEDGDSRQERNPLPACSHVVNHQACERLQEEEEGLKEKGRHLEEGEEDVSDIYKKLFSTIEAEYLTTPLSSPVLLGRTTASSCSSSSPLPFALTESPTSPSFTCSTRCSLSLPLPPTSSPPPPPSLHLHSSCLSPRLTLLLSPPEGLPPSCPKKHTHECNPSSSADLLSSLLLSQRKENDCLAPLQSLEGGEEEGPLDGKVQESLISPSTIHRTPLSVETDSKIDVKRTEREGRDITTGIGCGEGENREVAKACNGEGEEEEEDGGRREGEQIDEEKRRKGDVDKDLVSEEGVVAGFQERKKVQEVGSSNEDEPYREALLTGGKSVRCHDTREASIPSLSGSSHSLRIKRKKKRSLQRRVTILIQM